MSKAALTSPASLKKQKKLLTADDVNIRAYVRVRPFVRCAPPTRGHRRA